MLGGGNSENRVRGFYSDYFSSSTTSDSGVSMEGRMVLLGPGRQNSVAALGLINMTILSAWGGTPEIGKYFPIYVHV